MYAAEQIITHLKSFYHFTHLLNNTDIPIKLLKHNYERDIKSEAILLRDLRKQYAYVLANGEMKEEEGVQFRASMEYGHLLVFLILLVTNCIYSFSNPR